MTRFFLKPIAPLLLFSLALAAVLSTYVAAGLAPSAGFETAAAVAWAVLLVLWVVADARRRTGIPCFDFGSLCYFFFPVSVAWYCFWSRGWRGALLLLAIICTWIVPYLAARFVWQILYG